MVSLSISHWILPERVSALTNSRDQAEEEEKWRDWQIWQRLEERFILPLLSLQEISTIDNWHGAEQIQKLLTLRWYLLEWLKMSILEALRANNRIVV